MHQDNAGGSSGIHAICFRRPPSGVDGMAAGGKDCDNIGTHDSTPTITARCCPCMTASSVSQNGWRIIEERV